MSEKTDAEIAELAKRVKLSPENQVYTRIRNSLIPEAHRYALQQAKSQRELVSIFFARMDELMRTKGKELMKDAGI